MLSTMKKLMCLAVSGILLTGCGGSGETTDTTTSAPSQQTIPQPQQPTSPAPPLDVVPFDVANIVPFDFTQRSQGQNVGQREVLPAAFANVTGTINYPPNNADLSGNITVSVNVNDPDGIKNLFIGFDGVEQNILSVCSNGCGTSFSQTITGINPLRLGVSGAATLLLQLWVEDESGNRVFADANTIHWQPVLVQGLAATRSSGNLNLQWNTLTNYLRYNVYISTSEALSLQNYDSIALAHQSLALTNNSLNITTLDDETLYYALVVGVDGGGESAFSETLLINPLSGPPNQPPIAAEDLFELLEDQTFSGNLLANDADPDDEAVQIDTQPVVSVENGSLTINSDGSFEYTPPENFFGVEQFTYRISDDEGLSDEALVTLTILDVNDPPQAQDNSYNLADSEQSLNVTAPGLLANDSDIDFDDFGQVRVDPTPVVPPAQGELTLHPDGAFEYQPQSGFTGDVSFTYRITDGEDAEATASTTITIGAENTPPEAVNDNYVINKNDSLSTQADGLASLLANDSDADDNDLVSFTQLINLPLNGQLTLLDNGHFNYIPNTNFYGVDNFTYQISDSQGATSQAIATIVVLPQNTPPVAVADSYQLNEDTTLSVDAPNGVLSNDSDSDGDILRISEVAENPQHGQLQMQSDGSFTYSPNNNFFGTDTFVYTVTDGKLFEDSTTVTLLVSNVNDNPVANNDSASTRENVAVTIDVLQNDSDVEGDSLTIVSAQANNGSAVISNNQIVYTPNQGFSGDDTLSYTIEDGNGGSDSATVAIFVNNNNAPVAQNDNYTVAEDNQLVATAGSSDIPGVLDNDSDIDGDTLTVLEVISTPSLGSVSMAVNGSFVYVPASNNFGTDSFTYQISDGNGGTDTAVATIVISPSNDAPTALDDSYTINQDEEAVFTVLDNDFDVDGDTITITGAHGGEGEITVLEGTSIRYRPPAGFNGSDFFEYNITDGNGESAFANVNITIRGPNRPPIAVDDNAITAEDQSVTIDILANDSDPDGDPLFIVRLRADHGSVSLNGQNQVVYTPDSNFNGADIISYTIADQAGEQASAKVDVSVTPVNDNPIAVDDQLTVRTNSTTEFNPLLNDSDVDGDPLTITQANAQNGSVTINTNNTLTYTPQQDFEGNDSLSYTIVDNQGGSATATVAIIVERDTRENHPPIARDDNVELLEDTLVNINVLQNDEDVDGDPLKVIEAVSSHGETTIKADNTLDFSPHPNFFGQSRIDYTIDDGRGGRASAKVVLTVVNVNDAPVAQDDQLEAVAGQTTSLNVLANDSDVDGDSLRIIQAQADNGDVSIHDDVELLYTPPGSFTGTANVQYTITDSQGATSQATAFVSVNQPSPPPDARDDEAATDEDTPVTISVLSNDLGENLRISQATAEHGAATINSNNTVTFSPARDFNGQAIVNYTISNSGGSDSARVLVSVRAVNDPPIAVNDDFDTDEDQSITFNVLLNDSDVEGDKLTVTNVTADHGTTSINSDSTITYEPAPDFNGTAQFSYTVSDGKDSAGATIIVRVKAVNDNPVAQNDSYTISEDTQARFTPLDNDSDVDKDSVSISQATAAVGTVSISDGTTLIYTPKLNHSGTDSISYTITDNNGGTAQATVTVSITPVNDGPTLNDTIASVPENASVGHQVVTLDVSDPDVGDTFTFTITAGNDDGVFAIGSNNGEITVANTANLDFETTPSYQLTIVVTDSGDLSATAAVTINVTDQAENSFPLADADFGNTDEDGITATNSFSLDNDDSPQDAVMDAQGNIFAVGSINNNDIAIIKYKADGGVDESFGVFGRFFFDLSGTEVARAVDVDSSGNIFVAGEYNNGSFNEFFVIKITPQGQLDSTFGSGGTIISVMNQSFLSLADIVAHTDGSLLVGISISDGITVLKYDSTGTLQNSVLFDLPGSFDTLEAMEQQADGKVILAGHTADSSTFLYDFAVARITTADGLAFDTTFNSSGTHTFDLGLNKSDMIFGIGLQSAEHIVLVGSIQQDSGKFDVAAAVLTPDGLLDSNFGDGGVAIFDADGDGGSGSMQSYGKNVDIDGNDNLFIGTQFSDDSVNHDFGVVKTSANGTLDSSFGNGGLIRVAEDENENYMVAALLDSENRPMIVTTTQGPRAQDFALGRLTTSGATDTSFLGNGHIQNNISGSNDTLYVAMELKVGDNKGKFLLAGYTQSNDTTSNYDLIVARFNADGSLDQSYGVNGYFYEYANSADSSSFAGIQVYDGVELSDGRVVFAGSYNGSQAFLFMVTKDGDVDESFADGGKLIATTSDTFAAFQAVAVDNNGKIVTGGYQFVNTTDLLMARVNPDGTADTTFGNDGIAVIDMTPAAPNYEGINAIRVLSDNSLIIGGYHNNQAMIGKVTTAGALDTAGFNNGAGFQSVDANPDSTANFDYLETIEIAPDGTIYGSGSSSNSDSNGSTQSHILMAVNPDGSLNTTFADQGFARFDIGRGDARDSLALDANGNLVITGTVFNSTENGTDAYLARVTPSGVLDSAFNNGSAVTFSRSNNDQSSWIHVLEDGRILMAGNNLPEDLDKQIWYMLMMKLVDPCAETLVNRNAGQQFDQQLYEAQRVCR